MRILFLVARPTQFEAPFYRFAAAAGRCELKPLFWEHSATERVDDRELGRSVDWGFDVFAGYPYSVAPPSAAIDWIENELDRGCDLLIINGYTQKLSRAAAAAARKRGVPTALRLDSVRFPGDPPPSALRRVFVRHLLGRRFDLFLGTGSLTRNYLDLCGIQRSRQGLFPYAVDHEHFRAAALQRRTAREDLRYQWGVPSASRVVLAVSKLHPRETPWDLIAATAHLPEDVHVVLVGDGVDRSAVERHIQTTEGARLHLAGYVPYKSLPLAYAASDLFVHVPREERWGVSVAEALAAGLAVVAGQRVGAAHDLVDVGRNGFVVAPGSARVLADAIQSGLTLAPEGLALATTSRLAAFDYSATLQSLITAAAAKR